MFRQNIYILNRQDNNEESQGEEINLSLQIQYHKSTFIYLFPGIAIRLFFKLRLFCRSLNSLFFKVPAAQGKIVTF